LALRVHELLLRDGLGQSRLDSTPKEIECLNETQ
jgi:hypothetical protein